MWKDTHRRMEFCLKLAGMLSYEGGFLLKAYSYYFFTTFFIFGSSLFLYLYLDPKPIMRKLQTIHYLLALVQIFFKFLSIFYNQETVISILSTIEILSKEASTKKEHVPFIERANRISLRITKIFLFIFCGYYPLRTTNLLLKYLVFRRPPQRFMEGVWIPSLVEDKYVFSVFYQVATSVCTGFTNASYSIFIIFVTTQISAQMMVLRKMLEESETLEPSIILHQKLIRLFFQVNNLLSGLMFVEIVLTSFYTCVCSFFILQNFSTGGGEIGNHAHVLLLVIVRAFLICFCGNIIMKQGEKLHNSAYFGKWYEKDKKHRKAIQFILALTTAQPFQYNYRKIVTMDMAQFMKSMQTTYSYLTMLLSLTDYGQ
nr:olfactory receptor 42 [Tropidothorax elegans]